MHAFAYVSASINCKHTNGRRGFNKSGDNSNHRGSN